VLLLELKEPLNSRNGRTTDFLAEGLKLFTVNFCLFMNVCELLLLDTELISFTSGAMVLVRTRTSAAISTNLAGRKRLTLDLLL
jgi:hypothetical protein